MFLVTGDNPYWDCPLCGTRRDPEGTTITPGWNGYEYPDEPHTGENQDESPEGKATVPVPVTDHRPKCWNCGRVLGKYFSRPWSIRCRRCKASNLGTLKGA